MVYEIENDKIPFYKEYIALVILVINIIVFIIQLTDPTGNMYIYEAAFVPKEFFEGKKILTIISSMFMHGDIVHILMNMWFFYVIADNCENFLGHFWFLTIYLLSGIAGSVLHALASLYIPVLYDIPSLGASGAVYGLIAVYGILFPKIKLKLIMSRVPQIIQAYHLMILYFITELTYALITFGTTGTAHFAHIGGFITGAIFAVIIRITKKKKKK
ncbi:MAG: rhomboid family intramembrane serine protease, partial [Candidatus Lokiarchaeota archaeon]|nr:rhomboid family intramembrane serine protease [Candidatus Lokiarchaeota archaeon]